MTEITIYKFGDEFSIECKGHAGYAEQGKDIVCSACTILALTLAERLEEMYDEGFFQERPRIILEEGKAEISCLPKRSSEEDVYSLYKLIQTGYWVLQETYRDHVKLIRFGDT